MENILYSQDLYDQYLSCISNIKFTSREIDVIACIMHGKSIKNVANFLSKYNKQIETRTIETHISNIKRKIGINSKEGIIDFIEKSDQYKSILMYYSSLLIQCEFKKILKEISLTVKSSNQSFFIIIQTLKNSNTKSILDKISSDLEFIGIEVCIEFKEYYNNIHIVLNHNAKITTEKNKCTIYVICIDISKIDNQLLNNECVITYGDYNKSKVFCLLFNNEKKEHLKFITKKVNLEFYDLTLYKQYYYLFIQIIEKVFFNINTNYHTTRFQEKCNNIIYNKIDIIKSKSLISNKYISFKRKNIYYLIFTIFTLTLFSAIFFILNQNIITSIRKQKFIIPNREICNSIASKNTLLFSWGIPKNNNLFINRDKLLNCLNDIFFLNHKYAQNNLVNVVCVGPIGVGKTCLALQYIYHTKYPYKFKIWFSAENSECLYNEYINFAKLLGYTLKDKSIDIKAYVKQWLVNNPGWILIYDNVKNYDKIKTFLPNSGGHIILTSCQRNWPSNYLVFDINVMTKTESFKIIKTLLDRNITLKEQYNIRELVKILEYLPLSLVQASQYIKKKYITITDYLNLYKRYEMRLIMNHSFLKKYNSIDYFPMLLTDDIKINYEKLIIIELLIIFSYLQTNKVSYKLLLRWLQTFYPHILSPELTLNKCLGLLVQYSIIDYKNNYIFLYHLFQSLIYNHTNQILNKKNGNYLDLNLVWFESLLKFFIQNKCEFNITGCISYFIKKKAFELLSL